MPIVVNQSGVAYPGWAGEQTDEINRRFRRALAAADHVLYQSEFCKRSADEFLGEPRGSWEVLYNAVDVDHFTPGDPPRDGPVLLLGGDQTQAYRLELALRTFAHVLGSEPGAQLLVTGRLASPVEPLVDELGLRGKVELAGRYAQREAPPLFRHGEAICFRPKVPEEWLLRQGLSRAEVAGVRRVWRDARLVPSEAADNFNKRLRVAGGRQAYVMAVPARTYADLRVRVPRGLPAEPPG